MSGLEISEEQAAGIVAAAGLEPVDGCGALSGWRLGELNSRIETFLLDYQAEQGLSPSEKRKRFGLIAARTRNLLAALPAIPSDADRLSCSYAEFEVDAFLTQGASGCGDLGSLRAQLGALLAAAEAARVRVLVNADEGGRHRGEAAFHELLKSVVAFYMVLFETIPGLSRESPSSDSNQKPAGPLLRFVEAVLVAVAENRRDVLADQSLVDFLNSQRGEALMWRLRRVIPHVFPDEAD